MKQYLFTALLCALSLCAQAQRLSRDYQNESLSKVLEDLNAATSDQTIYFIYDELEDFTVTSHSAICLSRRLSARSSASIP